MPADLAFTRARWAAGEWTAEDLKEGLVTGAEEHGLKLGKAQGPVMVAVTGRTVGLPLFESVEVLGWEQTLDRIDTAVGKLGTE